MICDLAIVGVGFPHNQRRENDFLSLRDVSQVMGRYIGGIECEKARAPVFYVVQVQI